MKLSIITKNLNNSNGLEKTIKSVVTQKYSDYEYLIIDGGSTDDSVEVIRSNSNKITTWISELDAGIYCAMNKGINLAKGEYCLFLNSGDVLNTENLLNDLFKTDFTEEIVYGSIIYDSQGIHQTFQYPDSEKIDFHFFQELSLPHPSTFIKKTLFNRVGNFTETLKIVADWEFFLKAICQHKATIKKVPFAITIYDTTGLSSNKENESLILSEKQKVLKEGYEDFQSYRSIKNKDHKIKSMKFSLKTILHLFQNLN